MRSYRPPREMRVMLKLVFKDLNLKDLVAEAASVKER